VKVLLVVLGLVVVAGSAGATAASAGLSASVPRGVVTACTANQTRAALVSFVRAFNAGDYRRLNKLFAGPSWFRWYSSSTPGTRLDPLAEQRSTLIGYFTDRHAQHDRMKVGSFRFTGNSNGFGNFTWKMSRSAADFRSGAWFVAEAKGATLCQGSSAQFVVMSIGAPAS
jgi:hypothetical protein